MGVIFYFSSVTGLKVSERWVNSILSNIAHFTEFFVLCMLLFISLRKSTCWKVKKVIVVSCVFSVIYAFLDEFHQFFVPTRVPSLMDVFIDTSGIVTFGGMVWKRKFIE